MKKHAWPRFVFQIGLLVLISIISLFVGVEDVSLQGIFAGNSHELRLLWISRWPRLASIIMTGASLAIAGLIMQTITQNRFMSPDTAGTTEWCKFGIILVILFFPGASVFVRILVAFIVSLLGTFLFMGLLSKIKVKNVILMPLVGMMLGNVVNAITTFFAYQFDLVQNMTSWLQGSFTLTIKGNYELLYLNIPLLVIAYLFSNYFTIAGMGKDMTTSLGLNHAFIMRLGMVIVAMISALTIVNVGSIPFVGLIIPNLVSIYKGDSLRHSLFDTAWLGAIFVLVCDLMGRVIWNFEIPIGVMVSVVGSIIFLFILFRRNQANA